MKIKLEWCNEFKRFELHLPVPNLEDNEKTTVKYFTLASLEDQRHRELFIYWINQ